MDPCVSSIDAFNSLIAQWEQERGAATSPVPILKRMAELLEEETENFRKIDPDPFDDRHPARIDPDCALGELLAALFKEDDFMSMVVNTYVMSSREPDLQEAACRLLLDVIPGLETSIIYQETEGLLSKFIELVETGPEPTRSFATGLLAAAMEVQDMADSHREANTRLVPVMLQRLHELKNEASTCTPATTSPVEDEGKRETFRPFKCFAKTTSNTEDRSDPTETAKMGLTASSQDSNSKDSILSGIQALNGDEDFEMCNVENGVIEGEVVVKSDGIANVTSVLEEPANMEVAVGAEKGVATLNTKKLSTVNSRKNSNTNKDIAYCQKESLGSKSKNISNSKSARINRALLDGDADVSNSSWNELSQFIVGSHSIYPVTSIVKQRLILEYLTPLGEYQELLGSMFENGAMDLVLHYIDLQNTRDVRLTFAGMRYLAALLCHKKFAMEFVELGGVQKLLATQRPSLAATGVSLCIYYLAYNEGTMERMCLLPGNVLTALIEYAVWLLEFSHESGRCHATMFFTMSLPFGTVLEIFDKMDGLRKLVNSMSTLCILSQDSDELDISEDELFTSRQTIKHTCLALKRYFETHLAQKVDSIKRAVARNQGLFPPNPIPPYKAYPINAQITIENMEAMLEEAPSTLPWEPVRQFMNLQGVPLLIKAIAVAYEWKTYSGRGETIKSALDVLSVLTVTSKGQLQFCESVAIPKKPSIIAMSVLNFIAEGEGLSDAEVQKAALQVIINCVCGPTTKFGVNMRRFYGGSSKKSKPTGKSSTETLEKLWDCVRNDNGIKTLLNLLHVKIPLTEADSIRTLACKALCGLSRSESVKQILSKLPLFSNSLLQGLMREPVLQDKRMEHLKFCKYASELIERVTGKPVSVGADATIAKLQKANIVAQTRITYNKKELLQLIHNHLIEQGLRETADVLQREAELPCNHHAVSRPSTPTQVPAKVFSTPKTSPTTLFSQPSTSNYTPSSTSERIDPHTHGTPVTPQSLPSRIVFGPDSRSSGLSTVNRLSVRKRVIQEKSSHTHHFVPNLELQKQRHQEKPSGTPPSLDLIVSNYLKEQHANCKNPVEACPEFSLLEPHHCPEPRFRRNAPINAMSRLTKRSINPTHGGVDGVRCSRHFVYSRFRPVQTYRDPDEDTWFTCCAFSKTTNPRDVVLWLGNWAGELKAYNVYNGVEEISHSCHESAIKHIEPSKDGSLLLTSCYWTDTSSVMWSVQDSFEKKYEFPEVEHIEFGKLSEYRIIGTKKDAAKIYDTITGKLILSLEEKDLSNHYKRNRATFDPSDELVLNDGVLWDVRSAKSIYKFDQFQNRLSGKFHPHGLEIMINSEIWDIRTFHLLQTVPALDQCEVHFNHDASVIYGTRYEVSEEDIADGTKCPFGTSFRTFDGSDYTPIATIDVKKNIYGMASHPLDTSIAVLEYQENADRILMGTSVCHMYDVGRSKAEDEDDEEEEQDDNDEDGLDDDDDDDDDSLDDLLNSDDSDDNSEDNNGNNSDRRNRLLDALLNPDDTDGEDNANIEDAINGEENDEDAIEMDDDDDYDDDDEEDEDDDEDDGDLSDIAVVSDGIIDDDEDDSYLDDLSLW